MKIAVFHNLPSGGAKRVLYNFIKYLRNNKHDVDVFVPDTADEKFLPLKDIANKVEIFPTIKTFKGVILSLLRYQLPILGFLEKAQEDIATYVNKSGYDVVLVEQDRYTMSPFFLKFVEIPTVYYCQQPFRAQEAILKKISSPVDNWFIKTGKEMFYSVISRIDKQNASYSKYLLANSCFSRESILRNYGLNAFVSYLGIDIEVFRRLDVLKENYVLSVGACRPAKGFDFIIRAIGMVSEEIRPKLVIVSNTTALTWEDYLKQLALQKKVEIEIKHSVEDERLIHFYNKARLFLYAPYLEPFGLAALEAMACGTPVIAVKEGGVRESITHNETGILVERDEAIFAEAITELLSSPKKCDYINHRAMESVRNFWTLEHSGKRLLWHLEHVVNLYQSNISV